MLSINTLLIGVLVVGVGWSLSFSMSDNNDSQAVNTPQHKPQSVADYYARDFVLSAFAADGLLKHQISGQTLTHFLGNEQRFTARLVVEQPQARILSGKWQGWKVQAQQAERLDADKQWDFSGQVTIEKAHKKSAFFTVGTQQLAYDAELGILHTSEHVTLNYPYGKTESDGMSIDLLSEKIQLHANVISHYYPKNTP